MTADRLEIVAWDGKKYFAVRVGKLAAVLQQDEALWVVSCYLRGELHPYLKSIDHAIGDEGKHLRAAFPEIERS